MGAAAFAFQAVNSVGQGYVQADSMRAQADYEKKITELNNRTLDQEVAGAEEQASDALKRGTQAATRRAQQTRLQVGAQRAAMAANGSYSPDAVSETEAIGAADEAALRVNSFREAFGFQTKANQVRGQQAANTLQGRSNANALENMARSTMITGWTEGAAYGLAAYGKASDKKKKKSPGEI